ncbi:MAG: polyphosphate:AMP phosphotransferase, partial [Planctomycetota bacterium]|nr:polyphosphate:AMP phosphotransferase [Planctomycetota bacterium]
NLLHEWLDARYLDAHAFGTETEEEASRPDLWRYWQALPPKGRMGVLFGTWYSQPIVERVYGHMDDDEFDSKLEEINAFEKLLTDDGALIIKFWFHLSKKQQKNRLRKLEGKRRTRWRVTRRDWRHFKLYDKFAKHCKNVLEQTHSDAAPWTIVSGADARTRALTVGEEIRDRLAAHMTRSKKAPKRRGRRKKIPSLLQAVDLDQTIEKTDYSEKLDRLQGKLSELSWDLHEQGRGVVLVYQGWDAAGKGGNIRRLVPALDARQYSVIPVGAPTEEERAQHYLWRFWRHIPRGGRFTIFDRSWYGRVLVERIEGFATVPEWQRAYREINEFEDQLTDNGYILMKFWIHISKDEQLRRFKAREATPYKKHKITEEDYRNREKWDEYEAAVSEMITRTDKKEAPWTIVPGNCKRFARIHVLESVCDHLEKQIHG